MRKHPQFQIDALRCRLFFTIVAVFGLFSVSYAAQSKDFTTNQARIMEAPDWVEKRVVERTADKVQNYLEWQIKRVDVKWILNPKAFQEIHGYGDGIAAVAIPKTNTIIIGPRVTKETFPGTFGHELVHIVLYQKYKGAIPKWLEEGLANFIAKDIEPDYIWISKQKLPNIQSLGHPFNKNKNVSSRLQYAISLAVMTMIDSKCDVHDLFQMSLGKSLETYLGRLCGIENLQADFKKWLKLQAGMQRMKEKKNSP